MTIEEARNNLLETLESINKDKLSLPDLKLYSEILKTASEIQVKSFSDYYSQLSTMVCSGYKSPTLSEMKGDK